MRAEHRTSAADDDALQYIAARGAGVAALAVALLHYSGRKEKTYDII